ncbi:hypothetical protein CPB85DRAFT_1250648 [Mucidula mucida]|nr:hypothetical protein CPB85DRAFT_1250648 [Mucidula mucida]
MAFSIIRNIINKFAHSRRSSASTGPFGIVPQELLDLIIAYLGDDKVTLLSCALVHPAWTSVSRYHLPPGTLVVSSPARSKELVKLLRSSRETLSSSITGIALVGDVPFDDIAMNDKSPRAQAYRKLLQVLRAKHVALRSGVVENDPSIVGIFAHYFPALSEFEVTCASYQDITSFMSSLSGSFPHLTGLGIELGSGRLDIPDASLSGLRDLSLGMPRLRSLRSLRVVGWNNDLVRWLGDNIVGTLERLELESTSVWSACRVEEAVLPLEKNKQTLKDLKLSFVKRNVALDLSGLTRLEHLEVASGMSEALLLPRSLEKLSIRATACALASSGIGSNLYTS